MLRDLFSEVAVSVWLVVTEATQLAIALLVIAFIQAPRADLCSRRLTGGNLKFSLTINQMTWMDENEFRAIQEV